MKFSPIRFMKAACEKPARKKKYPKHTITFSNGNKYPVIGLGTFKSTPEKVTKAVMHAIDVGYRHIDCAHVYENEHAVGCGIKCKIDEGVVKREELFVTSKLWTTFLRPNLVRKAFQTTLDNLGLEYLDLYLIHWPMAYKEDGELFPFDKKGKIIPSTADYLGAWRKMEKLYNEGLIDNIGVSNFNSRQLKRLLDNCKVKPVNNQIEVHPYLNQSCLRNYCKCQHIQVTSYSPLGSPDRPWAKPEDKKVLDDKWIAERANKLNKSVAQLILRWNLQLGNIIIPQSTENEHIDQNIKLFDFELTKEDMEHFNNMDIGFRLYSLPEAFGHQNHPFEKDAF